MQVQLLLPEELHQLVWKDVEAKISSLQYSRVLMPLSALLEREFFNLYIKTGIHYSSSLTMGFLHEISTSGFALMLLITSHFRQHLDAFRRPSRHRRHIFSQGWYETILFATVQISS